MAFRNMMGPQGCDVDGMSAGANPLTRFLDSAIQDPMQAQMMGRAAQTGPMMGNPMMMGGAGSALLDPYQAGAMPAAQNSLDAAWGETQQAPMMMGGAMGAQLANHLQAPAGPAAMDQAFFSMGPGGAQSGLADSWAAEFAGPQAKMGPPAGAMAMEAAFQEAQMAQQAQIGAMQQQEAMQHMMMEQVMMEQQQASMEQAFLAANPQVAMQEMAMAEQQIAAQQMAEQVAVQQAAMAEQAWKEADPLETAWAQADPLEQAWDLAGLENPQEMLDQFEAAWKGAKDDIKFTEDNKYLDADDPLEVARQLLREGKDREALLALEAEVQKNPESSEGWRMLGEIYAEQDQDVEAIQCLRKGHEADPYNLQSLLALAVSCTNELDQLPALRYLRAWLAGNDEYASLVAGNEEPAQYEYEAWREQVTMLFEQAALINPLDADVFTALGVMENINRNYDKAVRALSAACRLRPDHYANWNKLGATLANSGKSEDAVVAYHQALTLKPNYARTWSNLAIAHANLGQHNDAARFYLSSLVLNPDASHIWNFLHSAVLNGGHGANAFAAIDSRDIDACRQFIDGVLDPSQLPPPKMELPESADAVLAQIGL